MSKMTNTGPGDKSYEQRMEREGKKQIVKVRNSEVGVSQE
jgi:hypothetical protein